MTLNQLVPVDGFSFFDTDTNPAETFPGTMWEYMHNFLFTTTNTRQILDSNGNPTVPYKPVYVWMRIL